MLIRHIRNEPPLRRVIELGSGEPSLSILDLCLDKYPLRSVGDKYRALQSELRESPFIILRSSKPTFTEDLSKDSILLHQLAGKEVMLLSPTIKGEKIEMSLNEIKGFNPISNPPPLADIRKAEVHSILENNKCIDLPAKSHYALPNGLHAQGYVALQKALKDPTDISRLSDWILPFVDGSTSLISDNGLMIPLLQEIRYSAMVFCGWKLEFTVLHGYSHEPSDLIDRIEDLLQRNEKILFLLSVNSSGQTANLARDYSPSSKIIAICDTQVGNGKINESFLEVPIERWKPNMGGKCDHCNTQLINIDSKSLEPSPQKSVVNFIPNKGLAESSREFWEAASRTDAVRLHFDIAYLGESRRHHSIYIDTSRLAKDNAFQKICHERLERIGRPDVVLIPKHANSNIIKEIVNKVYDSQASVPTHILDASEISKILNGYASPKHILVADDGVVTGATLRAFHDRIYEYSNRYNPTLRVDCFVMVSRPANLLAKHAAEYPFRAQDGNHFYFGAEVYLPYSEYGCPWCQEHKYLTNAETLFGGDQSEIKKRIRHLENEVEQPLLHPNPEGYLTLGSFFGNLTSKAAFAAMASVIQSLVIEIEGKQDAFEIRAVDLSFIVEAYFDAVFPAGALRTLDLKYCRVEEHAAAIMQAISTCTSPSSSPGLISELAWAAIQGKLPAEPIIALLKKVNNSDPIISQILNLLTRHQSA